MRSPFPLLATLALSSMTSAQVDMNEMIHQRMMQQQSGQAPAVEGMIVEDDNDPFTPNTFIGTFRLEMHFFNGSEEKKDSPLNMRYWSNADMTANQVEMKGAKGQDFKMVTDLKNKWQYLLMTDDKGGRTALKSRKKKVTLKEQPEAEKPVVTMTDETRMFDGYKGTKVIVTTPDGTWTGWVAKGIDPPFGDMIRNMKPTEQSAQILRKYEGVQGFPLEYEWADKDGKERTVCYVRELKLGSVDDKVFSLDGYEVTDMTMMPGLGK